MALPQTKRKVMGRIDIDPSNPPSSRGTHVSPPLSSSPIVAAPNGHVRKAKVNMASIVPAASPPLSSNGPPRAHVTASASPVVRSPLHGLPNFSSFSPAMLSAADRSGGGVSSPSIQAAHMRATSSVSVSRQSTRSPSPSRMRPTSAAQTLSPTLAGQHSQGGGQQRAKARPASMMMGQDGTWSAASPRAVPTSLSAKVAPLLDTGVSSRRHLRNHSSFTSLPPSTITGSGSAPKTASPLTAMPNRSRSPSPTLVKAYSSAGRRVSHGSNISVDDSSTASSSHVSGVKANSIGRSSYGQGGGGPPARPAMPASSYFTGAQLPSADSFASQSGLESPAHIPSPTTDLISEGQARPSNGSFTSPLMATGAPMQSPNVLLSPAVELDAEALEAKTNRKILDLEITNRSLLAINSGLEMVKLKQAREIRELKRRLRDGRALGSRMGMTADMSGDVSGSSNLDDDDEDEDDDGSDVEPPLNSELEQAHQRCKSMVDAMVAQARNAIMAKHDAVQRPTGNRVLHPAEVDAMREQEEEQQQQQLTGGEDDPTARVTAVAAGDDDDGQQAGVDAAENLSRAPCQEGRRGCEEHTHTRPKRHPDIP